MSLLNKISLFIVLLTMQTANSQDLSSHHWKDRIIILLTENQKNTIYQDQITELQKNASELKDRNLVVYHVTPNKLKKGLSNEAWKKRTTLFNNFRKTNSEFEFILIGLDGGIKLQLSQFITCEKLFAIIDAMPMRKSEMKERE